MITLKTASIRVEIDEEAGAAVLGVYDSRDRNALVHYDWTTPTPARNGLTYGDDDHDFHSGYRGGWQETFPNAGQGCVVDGVPHPFHGEATSSRWTVVERGDTSCVLTVGSRSPLELRREMSLDPNRAVLRIEEQVTNVGNVPAHFVWGHHPAFPAHANAVIDYPAGAVVHPDADRTGGVRHESANWPIARSVDGASVDLSVIPDSPVHRLAYIDGLTEGWAAIRQPVGGVSVGLAWDLNAHPFSWLWVMRDDPGFPFYGRARMVAIEAQTAWPFDGLSGARARGMAHQLGPGEVLRSWYTLSLFDDQGSAVSGVARDGSVTFDREA